MTQTSGLRPKGSVLLVEDEPRLRELLARAMTQWGFTVELARSAEEALRSVGDDPPEIALLDLNLPGMDGLECLSKLRERDPAVQGIVLTGFGSVAAAKRAVHLEVVEFLTKPCHLGELEKALDRAMRRLAAKLPAMQVALAQTPPPGTNMTLEELERDHILAILERHEGNRTAAAAALGISRRTLYYKLEEYQRQGFRVP
jgi:two-component system response regulator RegA